MTDCCGNCDFFFKNPHQPKEGPGAGLCRRYPPTVTVYTELRNSGTCSTEEYSNRYPEVEDTEWCGEHK